jgi:hypothetical protein
VITAALSTITALGDGNHHEHVRVIKRRAARGTLALV